MRNKQKKIAAIAALVVAAWTAAAAADVTAARAADDTVIYSSPEEGEAGLADEETKFPFTLKAPLGRTYFYISVFEPVGFTVTLYDKEGIAVADPIYIPSTSQHWEQYPDGFYKNGDSWTNIPSDDYFYGVKLDVDATYYLDIWHVPYKGKLSETDTVITAGFTKKLSKRRKGKKMVCQRGIGCGGRFQGEGDCQKGREDVDPGKAG